MCEASAEGAVVNAKVSVACTQNNAVTGPGLLSTAQVHEADPEFVRNCSEAIFSV